MTVEGEWKEQGLKAKASHIVIMLDPEDRERYPVYVFKHQNLKQEIAKLSLSEGRQKVVDVIFLSEIEEK